MKIVITIDSKTASLLLKLASDSHMSIGQLTTQLLTEALPKKQAVNKYAHKSTCSEKRH